MPETIERTDGAAQLIDDRPETVWLFHRDPDDTDAFPFAGAVNERDGTRWLLAMVCPSCAIDVAESVGAAANRRIKPVQMSLDMALDLAKSAGFEVPCDGLLLADHVGGTPRHIWVR